ncbi:hypothetical protein C1H46_042768 [Malus baccata]|uniref:Agglutinin domain-containing protein n=1 Tax=Malus baccata TaxID=106549 RepID=A0A540KBS7_MALBA|nr:hypothetical protein C1H46_042768 [Malus baccata]
MAGTLQSGFKWQSNYNRQYLRLDDGKDKTPDGILEFSGKDSSRIFKTKASSKGPDYVNIMHSNTKLYLAKLPGKTGTPLLIGATAENPNENLIDENCTLFELFKAEEDGPTNATHGDFRIRHAQSNLYLTPQKVYFNTDTCTAAVTSEAVLCAVSSNQNRGDVDLFTLTWG